jgi:hypothetical protein
MITRRCLPTPPVRHRGLVQYANDQEPGEVPHIRTRVKIGEGRGCASRPEARPAQRRNLGRLGVSEAQLRELRAKGVL